MPSLSFFKSYIYTYIDWTYFVWERSFAWYKLFCIYLVPKIEFYPHVGKWISFLLKIICLNVLSNVVHSVKGGNGFKWTFRLIENQIPIRNRKRTNHKNWPRNLVTPLDTHLVHKNDLNHFDVHHCSKLLVERPKSGHLGLLPRSKGSILNLN